MSYTVSVKLPETFFVETLTEKGEMLKKHLKDTNSNLVVCASIGPNMPTCNSLTSGEGFTKSSVHFLEPWGFKRTTISPVDSTELCVKGELDVIYMYIL